jgi:hypothetical protein
MNPEDNSITINMTFDDGASCKWYLFVNNKFIGSSDGDGTLTVKELPPYVIHVCYQDPNFGYVWKNQSNQPVKLKALHPELQAAALLLGLNDAMDAAVNTGGVNWLKKRQP